MRCLPAAATPTYYWQRELNLRSYGLSVVQTSGCANVDLI